MDADIKIHTDPAIDLKGALVVIGTPGLGFVGSIATRYLVEELKMQRIGGLHSAEFPPYVPVERGRPLHPVRLHHMETKCGLDLGCDRVVVMTSELFAGPRMVHPLSAALVEWSLGIEASLVLVPDAIGQGDEKGEVGGSKGGGKDGDGSSDGGAARSSMGAVHGVGSTDEALGFLMRADVAPLKEGAMMGLTAGLLAESERLGLATAAIVAGSRPDHPDARAAARLVEVLDKVLPGIRLESGPLLKRAEEIEANVKTIRAQMAQQAAQGQPTSEAPAVSMFH